jgi:hypothetical protein
MGALVNVSVQPGSKVSTPPMTLQDHLHALVVERSTMIGSISVEQGFQNVNF